jgi:hypothetical protein
MASPLDSLPPPPQEPSIEQMVEELRDQAFRDIAKSIAASELFTALLDAIPLRLAEAEWSEASAQALLLAWDRALATLQ